MALYTLVSPIQDVFAGTKAFQHTSRTREHRHKLHTHTHTSHACMHAYIHIHMHTHTHTNNTAALLQHCLHARRENSSSLHLVSNYASIAHCFITHSSSPLPLPPLFSPLSLSLSPISLSSFSPSHTPPLPLFLHSPPLSCALLN